MLNNILQLITENASESIIDNKNIPNELNEKTIHSAAGNILNGLMKSAQSNDISELKNLFDPATSNNTPLTQNIQHNFAGDLMSKFGLSNENAVATSTTLIPKVMDQLVAKTNDVNDKNFEFDNILKTLSSQNQVADFTSLFSK